MKFSSNSINSIIFDLGGVILNLNPQKTYDAFAKITGLSQDDLLVYSSNDVFTSFEKGEMPAAEFRLCLRNMFKVNVSDVVLDEAWNAMLLDLPLDRLEMIGELKNKYSTFVLSNTNEIHIERFDKTVAQVTEGNRIQSFFNEVYYSHQVGMRKPDSEIFQMVLDKNKLNPSQTLFIDDTLEHIESAKNLGLKTWHLTNQKDLFEAFGNG